MHINALISSCAKIQVYGEVASHVSSILQTYSTDVDLPVGLICATHHSAPFCGKHNVVYMIHASIQPLPVLCQKAPGILVEVSRNINFPISK